MNDGVAAKPLVTEANAGAEAPSPIRALLSRNRTFLMGVAILLIVICHAEFRIPIWRVMYPVMTIKRLTYGGVDLFFFLSGFGVCASLDRSPDAAAFYGRRLKRIYPAYLPIAALWVISVLLRGPMQANAVFGVLTGLGYWMQLPNQFMWYVSAILVFYAITPYLHAALRRAKNLHVAFALLMAGSLLIALPAFYTWQIMAASRLPVYIAGIYVYAATERRGKAAWLWEGIAYALMVVGFYLIINMPNWVSDGAMYYHGLFNYPFLLIAPGFCMLLARRADLLRRCFLRFFARFCESMGRCSLELCLIHFLVFETARAYFELNNWTRLGLAVLSILLSIPYAALVRRVTARCGEKRGKSAAQREENASLDAAREG